MRCGSTSSRVLSHAAVRSTSSRRCATLIVRSPAVCVQMLPCPREPKLSGATTCQPAAFQRCAYEMYRSSNRPRLLYKPPAAVQRNDRGPAPRFSCGLPLHLQRRFARHRDRLERVRQAAANSQRECNEGYCDKFKRAAIASPLPRASLRWRRRRSPARAHRAPAARWRFRACSPCRRETAGRCT